MRKILKVAQREYVATAKTKAFIIGVLMAPVIIGAIIFFTSRTALDKGAARPAMNVAVTDLSNELSEQIKASFDEYNRDNPERKILIEQVKAGEKVAIFGTGGVGMNCLQIAAAVGGNVIAVDMVKEKLDLALQLGASDVVDAKAEGQPAKKIRKISGGGVDVAMECIGNPVTIKTAYDSIKPGGRVIIVGYPAGPLDLNLARLMFREQQIIGSLGCRSVDFPHVIDLVRMGRIKVEPIVSGRFPLEDINKGLDQMRSGRTLRTVVVI